MKLKDIAKKINKAYGVDHMVVTADIVPEYVRIPSRSLGFSYPLYGGIPLGRIITFSGKEHSGKTTAAFAMIADYQRAYPDRVCVFVDAEHSADLAFQSKMNGIDLEKLYYVNTDTLGGEQVLDLIVELQQSEDIGMIVLDSVPALVSMKKMDSDIEKNLGLSGHMAMPIQTFLGKMQGLVSAKQNVLLMINQVRESSTPTGAVLYKEPGGSAIGYVPSIKVRFGTRTFVKGDNVEARDGEAADGFRLKFVITKNKTADIRRGGGFMTYNYETGLDYVRDALEIAMSFGFIHRPNNMTYILVDPTTGEFLSDTEGKELKFVGKQKLFDYLKENPEFTDNYIKLLIDAISNADSKDGLLDEDALAEIIAEENAVSKK